MGSLLRAAWHQVAAVLCVAFATHGALAADKLSCSPSASSKPSQGGNFLGRGWVNPHQTVQVCTTGIPATKPIDELLCQATLTIKNAQGHTEQKSYFCPSYGSPCQDIGVFSTPQRKSKEDGGTIICVSFQNTTGDSVGIFLKAHAPVEKR